MPKSAAHELFKLSHMELQTLCQIWNCCSIEMAEKKMITHSFVTIVNMGCEWYDGIYFIKLVNE